MGVLNPVSCLFFLHPYDRRLNKGVQELLYTSEITTNVFLMFIVMQVNLRFKGHGWDISADFGQNTLKDALFSLLYKLLKSSFI